MTNSNQATRCSPPGQLSMRLCYPTTWVTQWFKLKHIPNW